jgi:hypothetical protein
VLAGLVAVVCTAAGAVGAFGGVFLIRDVAVEGTHHTTVDAAVTASALVGVPLFTASATRARERLMRIPAVRDARVDILFPERARITLIERVALGRWVAGGGELFVDADGVLFGSLDARAAPEVRITDERGARQPGDRLDPALVAAAMRLARLSPADLRADATGTRVVLTPGGLVLRTAAGWEIRFGGPEGIDDKILQARRFLRDNEQRKLDYLDVRTPDSIVFSPR